MKCPFLQSLQNDPLKGGFWMEDPLFSPCQSDRTFFAAQCTNTASKANGGIDDGLLFLLCLGLIYRNHLDRIDRAGFRTLPTSDTSVRLILSDKAGSHHRIRVAEFADPREGIAAVLTAETDKRDVSFYIVCT